MANVRELYRAIAFQNALLEQARAEVRAEEAAKRPPVSNARLVDPKKAITAAPASLPGEESELHGLVRALWKRGASASQIGELLGYTERHIRRMLEQIGLRRPDAHISPQLRARCDALRQRRAGSRHTAYNLKTPGVA